MTSEAIEYIIVCALCAASISYTITWAGIFEWLRNILSKIHPKIDELIHCPYCFGHYVVLVILLTTNSDFYIQVTSSLVYNFLFTWFATVCLMSLLHFVMLRAYSIVAEMEISRKLKERRKKTLQK